MRSKGEYFFLLLHVHFELHEVLVQGGLDQLGTLGEVVDELALKVVLIPSYDLEAEHVLVEVLELPEVLDAGHVVDDGLELVVGGVVLGHGVGHLAEALLQLPVQALDLAQPELEGALVLPHLLLQLAVDPVLDLSRLPSSPLPSPRSSSSSSAPAASPPSS